MPIKALMSAADDTDARQVGRRGRGNNRSGALRRAQSARAVQNKKRGAKTTKATDVGSKRQAGRVLKASASNPSLQQPAAAAAAGAGAADVDLVSPLNVVSVERELRRQHNYDSHKDLHFLHTAAQGRMGRQVRDTRVLSIMSVASDDEEEEDTRGSRRGSSKQYHLSPPGKHGLDTRGNRVASYSNSTSTSTMSMSSSLGFTSADTLRMLVNEPLSGGSTGAALMTTEERVRVLEKLQNANALFLHEPTSPLTPTRKGSMAQRYRGSVTQEDLFSEELDTPTDSLPATPVRSVDVSSSAGFRRHSRRNSANTTDTRKPAVKRSRSAGSFSRTSTTSKQTAARSAQAVSTAKSQQNPAQHAGSAKTPAPMRRAKTQTSLGINRRAAQGGVVVAIGAGGVATTTFRRPPPVPVPKSSYAFVTTNRGSGDSPSDDSSARRLSLASTTLDDMLSTTTGSLDVDAIRFVNGSTDDDSYLGGGADMSAPAATVYDQMIVFSQTHKELERAVTHQRRYSLARAREEQQKSTTERVLSTVLGENLASRLVNFFSRS